MFSAKRTMEEDRLLRHQRKLRAQRYLRCTSDLLPIDQDAAFVQVVEPLQQLHKRRLARTGVADQPNTFSRLNAQGEIAEERFSMRAIAERHAVEDHLPLSDAHGIAHPARSATPSGCDMHLHHLFHFVHAALQVGHMLAHVAQ